MLGDLPQAPSRVMGVPCELAASGTKGTPLPGPQLASPTPWISGAHVYPSSGSVPTLRLGPPPGACLTLHPDGPRSPKLARSACLPWCAAGVAGSSPREPRAVAPGDRRLKQNGKLPVGKFHNPSPATQMGSAGATNEKSLKARVSGRELRPQPEWEKRLGLGSRVHGKSKPGGRFGEQSDQLRLDGV